MLTILPVRQAARVRRAFEEAGLPLPSGAFLMEAAAREPLALGFFALEGDACRLLGFTGQAQADDALLDGIARAGMNASTLEGCTRYALGCPQADRARLLALGFSPEGDIEEFFATVRHCKGC